MIWTTLGPMLLAAVLCFPWTLTSATESTPSPSSCPVTTPNGSTPPLELPSPFHHGNGMLWVDLYPQGRVVVSPEQVWRDGSIAVKFGWWRAERGQELTIEGRRLDAPAPPLRAEVLAGYDQFYFQATGLIFPTPGCWEVTGRVAESSDEMNRAIRRAAGCWVVTGRVGESSLTFVVLIELAGEADGFPATPAATPRTE